MKLEKKRNSGEKTMDRILVLIGITTVIFITVMIWLFYRFQSIPDQLVICYFAAVFGECGIMGWIKTTKEKQAEKQKRKEVNTNGNNDD